MEYTVKKIFPEEPDCEVVLSIKMDYLCWCQLEKSLIFKHFNEYIERLEDQESNKSKSDKKTVSPKETIGESVDRALNRGKDPTSGYLSEKARDDFLRYIISGLEKADRKNKVFSALIITNLIFNVIQILLLLLT